VSAHWLLRSRDIVERDTASDKAATAADAAATATAKDDEAMEEPEVLMAVRGEFRLCSEYNKKNRNRDRRVECDRFGGI
jgi:hypothetical protein